jgi:hypothetical protein
MLSNNISPIEAKSNTMAIFIKLFAIRIVAKSFLGFSKSDETISIGFDFSSKPLSISDRVSENKATSAPEINAEHTNRIIRIMILVINEVLTVVKNNIKLEGSGSNVLGFKLI